MSFSPGDVVGFWSDIADKHKYHLCVSPNNSFLFINSPKARTYAGDFVVPCSEIDCLEPTDSGFSVISCNVVLRFTSVELRGMNPKKYGRIPNRVLVKLLSFVEASDVLSDEDKEEILGGLGDWV